MNSNFKVIGLTRLGIQPESTAQETDALYNSAVVTSYGYKIVAVGGLSPDKIAVMGVSMFSTLIRVI